MSLFRHEDKTYRIENAKRTDSITGEPARWLFEVSQYREDQLGNGTWIYFGKFEAPFKTPRRFLWQEFVKARELAEERFS